ncbi:MAG: ABC transporter permease [Acetobacteraceae bacterium]|nr:ABC transporter permease [Acetobacteraceae bacterium]
MGQHRRYRAGRGSADYHVFRRAPGGDHWRDRPFRGVGLFAGRHGHRPRHGSRLWRRSGRTCRDRRRDCVRRDQWRAGHVRRLGAVRGDAHHLRRRRKPRLHRDPGQFLADLRSGFLPSERGNARSGRSQFCPLLRHPSGRDRVHPAEGGGRPLDLCCRQQQPSVHLLGVPVRATRVAVYVISGLLASFASVLSVSYISNAEATAGSAMMLQSIAAVVIGGASLFGGTGSAIGALLGALMITVIQNGVNLIGINSFWQGSVTGLVILIAVLVDRVTKAKR